jgi:hypothetical protein
MSRDPCLAPPPPPPPPPPRARFTARLPPDIPVDVGDVVRLHVDMDHLHFFDPDTTLALR